MKSVSFAAAALTVLGAFHTASADEGFATLKGIDAKPLAAAELGAIKGQHIHFAIVDADGNIRNLPVSENAGPISQTPFGTFLEVNFKENNLGNGQALDGSGPGYSGLCGAALLSPSLVIPFQNPDTGTGAGC